MKAVAVHILLHWRGGRIKAAALYNLLKKMIVLITLTVRARAHPNPEQCWYQTAAIHILLLVQSKAQRSGDAHSATVEDGVVIGFIESRRLCKGRRCLCANRGPGKGRPRHLRSHACGVRRTSHWSFAWMGYASSKDAPTFDNTSLATMGCSIHDRHCHGDRPVRA